MVTVKSTRPQEIRQRIQSAAAAEFAEKGYEGASMTSIAARAGIAARTLYNHAPRKDLLFFDIRLFDEILGLARNTPDGQDVVQSIVAYLEAHKGRDLALVDREAKAFESLLWLQLEEQLTPILGARDPGRHHAIVARMQAALIVLMARSLYWPEFKEAEGVNPKVQGAWLKLTGSVLNDAMVKLNKPKS